MSRSTRNARNGSSRRTAPTALQTIDIELAPGPDIRPPRLGRYPGLDGVLAEIARQVSAWRAAPAVRGLALALATAGGVRRQRETGHADMRDREGVAQALYRAVVKRVVYVNDPPGAELVQAPLDTWRRGMGDCEDMTLLGGALLAAVGVPVRAVTVGYGASGYDHIYLEYDAGDVDGGGNTVWRPWDATLASRAGLAPSATPQRRKTVLLTPTGGEFGLAGVKEPRVSSASVYADRLSSASAEIVGAYPTGGIRTAPPIFTQGPRGSRRMIGPWGPRRTPFPRGQKPVRTATPAPPTVSATAMPLPTTQTATAERVVEVTDPRPTETPSGLSPLLLLGGGALALLVMANAGGGSMQATGKKKRTVVTTDEDFSPKS